MAVSCESGADDVGVVAVAGELSRDVLAVLAVAGEGFGAGVGVIGVGREREFVVVAVGVVRGEFEMGDVDQWVVVRELTGAAGGA